MSRGRDRERLNQAGNIYYIMVVVKEKKSIFLCISKISSLLTAKHNALFWGRCRNHKVGQIESRKVLGDGMVGIFSRNSYASNPGLIASRCAWKIDSYCSCGIGLHSVFSYLHIVMVLTRCCCMCFISNLFSNFFKKYF